jgi:hypothetical protein
MNQHERINPELSQVIEEGVRLDALQGVAVAWAYLQSHSVDTATILRVLSDAKARRRAADAAVQAGKLGEEDG